MAGVRSILGLGFCLVALGACGDDDDGGDGGGSVASLCTTACEKGATLNCPNEPGNCAMQCQTDLNMFAQCETQARAFLNCGAARPASDYECGSDSESTVRDTVCTSEQTALGQCILGSLSAGASGGGAGSGGGGGSGSGSCMYTNDGECDEPDFCPPGTDTADCS